MRGRGADGELDRLRLRRDDATTHADGGSGKIMRLRAGGVGRATCQGNGEPEHQPQPHSSLPSFFPAFAQGEVSQAIRRIVWQRPQLPRTAVCSQARA